jgi:hypothetical protein
MDKFPRIRNLFNCLNYYDQLKSNLLNKECKIAIIKNNNYDDDDNYEYEYEDIEGDIKDIFADGVEAIISKLKKEIEEMLK